MRKLKLYLDTSVWNFVFANDAPEKKEITVSFFENIQLYDIYISEIVLDEIEKAPKAKRILLEDLINKYEPKVLDIIPEIPELAVKYIENKILPEKEINDALHIAACVLYEIDILLTWNYKHLANVLKKRKVNSINIKEGFTKTLDIITPIEVSYND